MADNVTADPGSGGATFRTDDDGTAHWPYTKLAFGPDNTQTIVADSAGARLPVELSEIGGTAVAVNTGVVDAGTLRVTVATDDTVTVDGTVTANLSATDNAVLDNIQTSVDTLAAAVSTEVQVDIVGVTPDLMLGTDFSTVFGTTNLITVAALADALANTTDVLNVRNLNYVFNGTSWDRVREGGEAGSILVDLGSNNDVSVSGTVTANLSATDNAVLDTIDSVLDTINAKLVTGTVIGDVNLGATDNAVLDAIAASNAAIQTAVEILDNTVAGNEMQVDIVSGGTGSTQYIEDSAHNSGDTGTMVFGVHQSTQADFGQDGDYVPFSIDDDGGLRVSVVAGTGGTHTDDTPFGEAVDDGVPVFARFNDTTVLGVDEGDAGILRMSANRNLYSTLRDAAGNERGANVDSNNNLQVILAANSGVDIGDVDVTSVVPGTAATNLGKAIDTAAGATDTGVATLAVRDDSLTTLTPIDGDYVPLRVNSTGALHVTGGGGGTEYTVDDANPTVVSMAGVVRDDTLTTLTEVDGDATLLRVNSTGALHVTGGGGGTEYTEDVATANPIVGTATLMERDDALTTVTPIEGDWIGLRGSAEGALWVQDFNSDAILSDTTAILADTANMDTNLGTIAGAVAGSELQVDLVDGNVTNAGTFAVQVDGDTTNLISTNNSTTSTLAGDAVWTATADDVSQYAAVTITLYADQASATDGMTFQFSTDNSNWDDVYSFTMAAGGTRRFQFPVTARYFRNVYTNGSTIQGAFRVQTILHSKSVGTSIHRVQDDVSPDRSATVVKSVLLAQAAGSGDFTPIDATAGGNLKVSISELSDGADVGNGAVGTETLRVTVASDSTGVLSVDDNGGSLTVDGTVTANLSATDNAVLDTIDAVLDTINAKLVTGTVIGDVNLGATDNAVLDSIVTNTNRGSSHYRNIDANAEAEIKGSAGTLHWVHAINLTAAMAYLHVYDATAASVIPGTTTPNYTFPIPTQGDTNGAGFNLKLDQEFANAITIVVTTTTDGTTGDPGTNGVMVNAGYA